MSRNFIQEIGELHSTNVYIKNKDNVNKLIEAIIKGRAEKLQVVSDFDRTITKQHENGKAHLTSFAMFSRCRSVPPDFLETEKKLSSKYLPLEINPCIPFAQKRAYMEEWWELSETALKGLHVPLEEIYDVAKELGPSLRDGTLQVLQDLNAGNVPVLVFSAGLGDSVVAVLKFNGVLLPNVKVISNFLKYENGVIQGFKNTAIHVLNKNEYALKGTEYYDLVQDRENILLLGDSLGDAGMADGVPHSNTILKIGFLYDHVNDNLPHYMDTFDIVLVDDQTMNVLQGILKYIL